MVRTAACLLAVGCLLAGCTGAISTSSSPAASTAAASPDVTSTEASEDTAAIVGVWRGEHECEGIADALTEAGFDESVVIENIVGNGLIPGVDSPEDVASVTEACAEATPLEHSHEFTADGEFFSYDQDGNEVDAGRYELVDENTLLIGPNPPDEAMTFDFAIEGDHLALEPDVPVGCLEFPCLWAVMVAMPWSGLDRVE